MKNDKQNMVIWHTEESFKKVPWKNGLGETLEIFKIVDHTNDFLFRLSIANMKESASFSIFPGVDRILLLLSGDELVVTNSKAEKFVLYPLTTSYQFEGEEIVQGVVKDPCIDFNVMTKRSWGSSTLSIQKLKHGECFKLYNNQILYQHDGELRFLDQIKKNKTLWEVKNDMEVESVGDSTSIIVTILKNNRHTV